MAANPQYKKLLKNFREVATRISHEDIRGRISAAITEHYENAKEDDEYGPWCYVVAVLGDDKSGDVVYFADGDLMKCSYSMRTTDSKATCTVDCENSVEVAATTTYLPKEAARTAKAGTQLSESDEATFVESMGYAAEVLNFREAAGAIAPLAKIISPGRGSSGYYTKEVLQRDGPKIFGKGTLMYINHATDAEEAARPEGDYSKLASVTTDTAYWDENGPDGPALYAPTKVFSGVAVEVAEKAPYTGLSIRAAGLYAEAATGLPKKGLSLAESKIAPDGKPGLIGQLTRADSIDLVTKAGRDGKLLLESATAEARPAQAEISLQEAAMDAAEFKKLQESNAAQALQIRKLTERAAVSDAGAVIAQHFTTLTVGEAVKKRVTGRILAASVPLTEAGELDKAKLIALVESEAKEECAFISEVVGHEVIAGMGSAATPPSAAEIAASEAEVKAELEAKADNYGVSTKEGKNILTMGRTAFRPDYNSRLKETA